MEQQDLSPDAEMERAVEWLMMPRERTGKPTVVELRELFGLKPSQACDAIKEAHLRKARAL